MDLLTLVILTQWQGKLNKYSCILNGSYDDLVLVFGQKQCTNFEIMTVTLCRNDGPVVGYQHKSINQKDISYWW